MAAETGVETPSPTHELSPCHTPGVTVASGSDDTRARGPGRLR